MSPWQVSVGKVVSPYPEAPEMPAQHHLDQAQLKGSGAASLDLVCARWGKVGSPGSALSVCEGGGG